MPKFYWGDWPFIIVLSVLIFAMSVYVITGVNLFPGDNGGRWLALVTLTGMAGILCAFFRANREY